MQESNLNTIKAFESSLKKCLQIRFGNNLPQDKLSLLNNSEYIDEKLKEFTSRDAIQGYILRKMLGGIIKIVTNKSFTLDDGSIAIIEYGKDIEDLIIEYYAKDISQKYLFSIDENNITDSNNIVNLMIQQLGEEFEKRIFNENIIQLLSSAGLEEIAKKYDKSILDNYIEKNKKEIEIVDFSEQQSNIDISKPYVTDKGSIQIETVSDEKYIKYTDTTGKIFLIGVENNEELLDFYKKEMEEQAKGKKIDLEEFFNALKTISLSKKNNNDEVEMLELFNPNIIPEENKIEIEQVDFDLIDDNTNDGIGSENEDEDQSEYIDRIIDYVDLNTKIKPKEIDEDKPINSSDNIQNQAENIPQDNQRLEDSSADVLTTEEYEELCMKYAMGDDLTDEELKSLLRFSSENDDRNFRGKIIQENSLAHSTNENVSYHGFSRKSMLIYLAIVSLAIGLFFGLVIFK